MSGENTAGPLKLTGSGDGPSGGTVTTVSVVSANGFAGSVANADTTPAITISTTITGILKGNGTEVSAATAGTDYENPLTFSTGLTRDTNTITNNLSTGLSGGQTLIGSTSTNSGLTIKATSGVGTTGADIIFQVGNNGATEAARITNAGNLGIGVSPGSTTRLDIKMAGNTSGFTGISITNSDSSKLLLYRGDGRFVFSGNLGIIPVSDGEEVYFNVLGSRTVKFRQGGSTGDTILATVSTTGLDIVGGTIKTIAPTGGTAATHRLGSLVTAAVTPDITRYVEGEVGGVAVKYIIAA